jgi:hypothetical protein
VSVFIARCPEHGLHGDRQDCFECGGSVEQVEMVEAAKLTRYMEEVVADARNQIRQIAENADDPNDVWSRCVVLHDALGVTLAALDKEEGK